MIQRVGANLKATLQWVEAFLFLGVSKSSHLIVIMLLVGKRWKLLPEYQTVVEWYAVYEKNELLHSSI